MAAIATNGTNGQLKIEKAHGSQKPAKSFSEEFTLAHDASRTSEADTILPTPALDSKPVHVNSNGNRDKASTHSKNQDAHRDPENNANQSLLTQSPELKSQAVPLAPLHLTVNVPTSRMGADVGATQTEVPSTKEIRSNTAVVRAGTATYDGKIRPTSEGKSEVHTAGTGSNKVSASVETISEPDGESSIPTQVELQAKLQNDTAIFPEVSSTIPEAVMTAQTVEISPRRSGVVPETITGLSIAAPTISSNVEAPNRKPQTTEAHSASVKNKATPEIKPSPAKTTSLEHKTKSEIEQASENRTGLESRASLEHKTNEAKTVDPGPQHTHLGVHVTTTVTVSSAHNTPVVEPKVDKSSTDATEVAKTPGTEHKNSKANTQAQDSIQPATSASHKNQTGADAKSQNGAELTNTPRVHAFSPKAELKSETKEDSLTSSISKAGGSPNTSGQSPVHQGVGSPSNTPHISRSDSSTVGSEVSEQLDSHLATPASPLHTAKLTHTGGQTELHVGLNAGELGNVAIRTFMVRDQVKAEISVQREELKTILTSGISEIQNRVAEKQGSVPNIVFSNAGGQGQGSNQSPETYRQNTQSFSTPTAARRVVTDVVSGTVAPTQTSRPSAQIDIHM